MTRPMIYQYIASTVLERFKYCTFLDSKTSSLPKKTIVDLAVFSTSENSIRKVAYKTCNLAFSLHEIPSTVLLNSGFEIYKIIDDERKSNL